MRQELKNRKMRKSERSICLRGEEGVYVSLSVTLKRLIDLSHVISAAVAPHPGYFTCRNGLKKHILSTI